MSMTLAYHCKGKEITDSQKLKGLLAKEFIPTYLAENLSGPKNAPLHAPNISLHIFWSLLLMQTHTQGCLP